MIMLNSINYINQKLNYKMYNRYALARKIRSIVEMYGWIYIKQLYEQDLANDYSRLRRRDIRGIYNTHMKYMKKLYEQLKNTKNLL